MELLNTSKQVIEFIPSCLVQAQSKRPDNGPGNENTELVCTLIVLHVPSIIYPVKSTELVRQGYLIDSAQVAKTDV